MNNQKDSNVQPGFCIAQQPGTLSSQACELFRDKNREAAMLFMQLNSNTSWVKPGQLLIVADPNNKNQSSQIENLRKAKRKVDHALATTDAETSSFLNTHYGTIAALTNILDKSTGTVSDAGEKYFSRIAEKLKQIEITYQNQFRTQGSLISQQFFSERARLFAELEGHLNGLAKSALKFRPYDDLKRALNLSSRSIVHDWQTAGIGAIKGYSSYIDRASGAAKYMKMGGWVAIGFAGLNTTNEVHHACTTGREGECKKVAVREYTKFGLSTAASMYGGAVGATGAATFCVAIGLASGGVGTLACGIVGGVAAGTASGAVAEKGTDYFMDWIL
ncbi:hypothetical protein AAGQ96_03115 [Pantoea sp. MBD-2R]|uniref:hypothetical protein n=1 Tax=Pantoea sp. MBD-2R TaxID=3141540 RepID=UPI00318467BC